MSNESTNVGGRRINAGWLRQNGGGGQGLAEEEVALMYRQLDQGSRSERTRTSVAGDAREQRQGLHIVVGRCS